MNSLYSLHAKNDMPQELEHPATLCICHFRVNDPLPKVLEITQWPLHYPRTRDGELCAARSADLRWGILISALVRQCTVEYLPPYLRCNMFIFPVLLPTARVPITTKIGVAILLHKRYPKRVESIDIGMQRCVGVPGRQEAGAVGVHKCHCGREGGVVVDDIG